MMMIQQHGQNSTASREMNAQATVVTSILDPIRDLLDPRGLF